MAAWHVKRLAIANLVCSFHSYSQTHTADTVFSGEIGQRVEGRCW